MSDTIAWLQGSAMGRREYHMPHARGSDSVDGGYQNKMREHKLSTTTSGYQGSAARGPSVVPGPPSSVIQSGQVDMASLFNQRSPLFWLVIAAAGVWAYLRWRG